MTADLLNESAPDSEDFAACWLQPLIRAATERDTDELPFCVIARIDGDDDPYSGEDSAVLQFDIYGEDANAASIAAWRVHRRMMLLSRDTTHDIVMSDGTTANADSVASLIKPRRMPYAHDRIVRYVARYRVGLSYVVL